MKNIAHFEDTVKASNNIPNLSNDGTKKKLKNRKCTEKKRNRVKIKITRTNERERVCDIIENSNDMIDKTPSPFAKENSVDKSLHETSKTSLSKFSTKNKKLINHDLNHLTLKLNDFNNKTKKQTKVETYTRNSKKHKKELSNTINMYDEFKNEQVIDTVKLINIDSDDKVESDRKESNAFNILMNHNKPDQYVLPIKPTQNKEINIKKADEYKQKLKQSNEKLIVLVDKKGYSKRKLAEVEEDGKIEQMIQNRMKLFKKEEKQDNSMSTTALNCKQSAGTLLNYFSKTPVEVTHTNMSNISTIVVKADVHVTENISKHSLYRSNSNNGVQTNKISKKSDLEFSQMDDIRIISSGNNNISSIKNVQQDKQWHTKHRWSLQIKLQTCRNKNASSGESSNEKLFSSRNKLNIEPKTLRNVDSENLSIKDKRNVSKETNKHMKLKLKRLKSSEHNIVQDNEPLKKKKEKQDLTKFDDHISVLIQDKNFNSNNLENVIEDKQNQEDCVLIENNNSRRNTNRTNKLAPLFAKRKKPDTQVIAARRLFLQPDIADNSNKNQNQKINSCGMLPFPSISHITQLSISAWNETNTFNIPKEICNKYVPIINTNNFKYLMDLSKKKLKILEKVKKPKVQDVLADIEKHYSNIKEMWNVISFIVKKQHNKIQSPKTKIKKNKQSEKKENIEYKSKEDQHEYCSWTYKYRPKSSQEIVGNDEAVTKLKEWLLGWKATFTNDVSSEDEFYSSDSNSKISENNQVAVLLGPHGCGKTASVYAVAEEFDYIVLELNASSRRTGRKLLKELEEATKSHRIEKDKKTSVFSNLISDNTVPKRIPQNSLILIEDVDIIFEEDEGFISATYQLASNSKRPIVMTCRDVCPHLNKMAPQQNRIYFKSAAGNKVSALLELISLAETGYRLPLHYITELSQSGDLRKAILQLQYLLLSGPPQKLEETINFKNLFWQNMQCYVYKPAIKISRKREKRKEIGNEITNSKSILTDVASKLDNTVLLSNLIDVKDSALNLWQIKTQPNLSLIENTASYSASSNICLEIAEYISNKIMYKDQLNEYNRVQYHNNIMQKKQLNERVNLALSHTTSFLLDRQIIAIDYLPSVRAICRAEESRANTNNKRGNRFFHYLHNLKASSTLFKSDILTTACKVMYDTIDNDIAYK